MLAIIGGSGLYALEDLQLEQQRQVTTPFGEPSAPIAGGCLQIDQSCFWLATAPGTPTCQASELSRQCFALKKLGARRVLGICCGSLRMEIRPGELALAAISTYPRQACMQFLATGWWPMFRQPIRLSQS